MPSGASASTAEPAEPPLLLLQQRLAGLGLGKEEGDGGEPELLEEEEEEEEEEDDAAAALMLLPSATSQLLFDAVGSRAMMAAVLPQPYGGAAGLGGEQAALLRRKSFNTTECVAVPSSEHVAEIVGRQGRW